MCAPYFLKGSHHGRSVRNEKERKEIISVYMKTHTPYIPCCSSRGENEEKTAEREIYISQILYSAQIFLWQRKKKPLYRASFITYRVYSYLIFFRLYPIRYKLVVNQNLAKQYLVSHIPQAYPSTLQPSFVCRLYIE